MEPKFAWVLKAHVHIGTRPKVVRDFMILELRQELCFNKKQYYHTFEHLQKHIVLPSLCSQFEPELTSVSLFSLPRKLVMTLPRPPVTGRAWGSPWSWRSRTDRQLYVSKCHTRFWLWIWSNINVSMLWFQIEVVPSASALIIKALKEPPRDRKKVKNSKWRWVHTLILSFK